MAAHIVAFPHKERPQRYILQNDNLTPVYQRSHWADWMAKHSQDLRLVDERDGIFVLTEFTGLDHNLHGEPALWKTSVLMENSINPIHGLYWTFTLETDATWFHNYLVMRVTGRRNDLEFLGNELMHLLPQNDVLLYGA